MKKIVYSIIALAVVLVVVSSCTASKKDCQGVRHYKQKGGFYM